MKKTLNSVITVVLLLVISVTMLFTPVSAASSAQISIRTVSSQGGTYTDKTDFTVGDKIYLPIKFSGIGDTGVQGFSCEITFNKDALTFSDSTFAAVTDESAVFYKTAQGGTIYLMWDSTSKNTVFNGDVFFVIFETKEVAANTELSFTIKVNDLYSSASGKPDIPYTISTGTVTATVVTETIDEAVLAAFRKLENITVDSLADIVAAETAWNGLTEGQKQLLAKDYKNEYNWLSTARNRLNELLNQASIDEINKLVQEYQTTYKDVLNLTTETVKPENAAAINAALTAYKVLPTSVTTRLDKNIPSHLQALLDQLAALTDALEDAQEFEETYGYLTGLTDTMLESAFELYSGLIDESIMVHDLMSDAAKNIVTDTYNKLAALKQKCDEIAANDAAKAAIRAEVNAFQQKWLKVFTLNTGNVTVYDRTAIEMVLDDYNKLSAEAQESLASRMVSISGLLDVIRELETVVDNPTDDPPVNVVVENPDPEIQEVVVEKEVAVTNTRYLNKDVPKTIWLLFILLAVAVLSLAFPLVMTIRYKKRLATLSALESIEVEEEQI